MSKGKFQIPKNHYNSRVPIYSRAGNLLVCEGVERVKEGMKSEFGNICAYLLKVNIIKNNISIAGARL